MISAVNKTAKRIGVFGGTFDPIHYGHLIVAQYVAEELSLHKVLFLPAGRPPHKTGRKISHPKMRYHMVKRAIAGNKLFSVSDLELSPGRASYTVISLKKIKKLYPTSELFLLIGVDQALSLSTWKQPEEILKLSRVMVMVRPGYDSADIEDKWKERVRMVEVPLIEISASDIRRRVASGKNIKYLVPDSVEKFIKTNKLYTENN